MKTVALVYNVKSEASTQSSLTTGHTPQSPDEEEPPSRSLGGTFNEVSLVQQERHDVGDRYAEWDTIDTINAVRDAIEERYDVRMIEADENVFQQLREFRPEFVFNIAEGLHGVSREAQVPAMLEMLCIPYLGSDPLTLALCLDKGRTKEILSYHKIPTAEFTVVRSMEELENVSTRFPAMVKPLHEGSSKGIYNTSVVHDGVGLEREITRILTTYEEPALVEEYLPGREFTVAILGNGDDLQVLPIVEIKFDALPHGVNHIYSYEAKWIWDQSDNPLEIFACPAQLEGPLRLCIEKTCRDAYRALNCRDWSRIDVRLDAQGVPCIIEVNPLPGILPRPEDNSCFPKAARAAGMSYNQLIHKVLDVAMARCGLPTAVFPQPAAVA